MKKLLALFLCSTASCAFGGASGVVDFESAAMSLMRNPDGTVNLESMKTTQERFSNAGEILAKFAKGEVALTVEEIALLRAALAQSNQDLEALLLILQQPPKK